MKRKSADSRPPQKARGSRPVSSRKKTIKNSTARKGAIQRAGKRGCAKGVGLKQSFAQRKSISVSARPAAKASVKQSINQTKSTPFVSLRLTAASSVWSRSWNLMPSHATKSWKKLAVFFAFAFATIGSFAAVIGAVNAAPYVGPSQAAPGGNMPTTIWNWASSGVTQTGAQINIDGDITTQGNLTLRSGASAQIQIANGEMFLPNNSTIRVDRNGWSQLRVGNTTGGGTFTLTVLGDILCCENFLLSLYDDVNTTVFDNSYNVSFRAGGADRLYIDGSGAGLGNVGIGASDPAYKLDVNGAIRTGRDGTDGQVIIFSEQGATDYSVTFQPAAAMTQNVTYTLPPNDGNSGQVLSSNGTGTLTWVNAATGTVTGGGLAGHVPYWTSASSIGYDNTGNIFWDATNDRLGIGTITPVSRLDVPDIIQVRPPASPTYPGIGAAVDAVVIGDAATGSNTVAIGNRAGGSGSAWSVLVGYGAGGGTNGVPVGTADNDVVVAVGSGALGGGTGNSYSAAIGSDAMYYAGGATENVAIGYETMMGGVTNFTASRNVALGNAALLSATNAVDNVAVGYHAGLTSNPDPCNDGSWDCEVSTGDRNTLLGMYAVTAQAGGVPNDISDAVAIGWGSVVGGNGSVAVGAESAVMPGAIWSVAINGYVEQDSSIAILGSSIGYSSTAISYGNADGDYSIAIGPSTQANANNSIAIGYGAGVDPLGVSSVAIGNYAFTNQANTIMLGPTAAYGTYYVGIGTATPEAELEVAGLGIFQLLKMTDGAAAGYILTSDVDGLASWQSPPSGGAVFVGVAGADVAGGAYGSYAAANAICYNGAGALAGSHMCSGAEILQSIARVAPANPIAIFNAVLGTSAWISSGPPGFTSPAVNDCNGWSSSVGTAYGSIWTFANTGGRGYATTCSSTYKVACCK